MPGIGPRSDHARAVQRLDCTSDEFAFASAVVRGCVFAFTRRIRTCSLCCSLLFSSVSAAARSNGESPPLDTSPGSPRRRLVRRDPTTQDSAFQRLSASESARIRWQGARMKTARTVSAWLAVGCWAAACTPEQTTPDGSGGKRRPRRHRPRAPAERLRAGLPRAAKQVAARPPVEPRRAAKQLAARPPVEPAVRQERVRYPRPSNGRRRVRSLSQSPGGSRSRTSAASSTTISTLSTCRRSTARGPTAEP